MERSKEVFNANLKILRTRPMGVSLSNITFTISKDIKIFSSKTGNPFITYKEKSLNSRVNPVSEGEKFSKELGLSKGDFLLLYGFGLGYHIKPILKIIGPTGRLIVLEFNQDILSCVFSLIDYSGIFISENFWLIGGGDEREVAEKFYSSNSIWEGMPENKKKVAIYLPSYQSIPNGFEHIKNAFEILRMERRFNTILGEKSKNNIDQNRAITLNSPGVKNFFGKFKGKTGFLIGSGPSLDTVVRYLKYIPSNSLVMTVDSVLSSLIERGISVDFVISIDPQAKTIYHIDGCLHRKIPLIFMPQTNPLILTNYAGPKYVVLKNTGKNSLDEIDRKGGTEGGGSVSCVALDLLIKFGANPIITAGIDSSFPWNRYYSTEIKDNAILTDQVNKHITLKELHRGGVLTEKTVNITNTFNREILTHRNLYSYNRTITDLVNSSGKDIKFYQWNGHGGKINGVKNIPYLYF